VKPVRCQPHERFRPRVGATRVPMSAVLGWRMAGPLPKYVGPPWPASEPDNVPEAITPEDLAAWRARHPEATCSDRVARCLAWLTREFAPR
jgi:hypothetical protein